MCHVARRPRPRRRDDDEAVDDVPVDALMEDIQERVPLGLAEHVELVETVAGHSGEDKHTDAGCVHKRDEPEQAAESEQPVAAIPR